MPAPERKGKGGATHVQHPAGTTVLELLRGTAGKTGDSAKQQAPRVNRHDSKIKQLQAGNTVAETGITTRTSVTQEGGMTALVPQFLADKTKDSTDLPILSGNKIGTAKIQPPSAVSTVRMGKA